MSDTLLGKYLTYVISEFPFHNLKTPVGVHICLAQVVGV